MNTNRYVIATIAGFVTMFILVWVIFMLLFGKFYDANTLSIEGVTRSAPVIWSFLLSGLAYTVLIVYAIGNRANTLSILEGAKIGAIVGLLLWITADFGQYSFSYVNNLTLTIVDPILEAVHAGIVGAVIAAVLKKMPASAPKTE